MKKLFLAVLITILALSVLVIPAAAAEGTAGSVTIEVTSTSTQVYPGEKGVTFVFTLKNSTENYVSGVTFDVTVPSGLTVTGNEVNCKNLFIQRAEYVGNRLEVSTDGQSGPTGDVKLLTLVCDVDDNITVNQSMTMTLVVEEVSHYEETFTATPVGKAVMGYHRDEDHKWIPDEENTTAATCTKDGVKAEKCSDKQCDGWRSEIDLAKGHNITFKSAQSGTNDEFTWNDEGDASTATVWVTCSNSYCDADGYGNGGKQVNVDVVPNGKGTGATCTTGGTVGYTGTVSIPDDKHDGGAWTLTKEHEKMVDPAGLGHDWQASNVDWSAWGNTEEDVTTPFKASITCARCGQKYECNAEITATTTGTKQDPTCVTTGSQEYQAVADFTGKDTHSVSGSKLTTFTEKKTVTLGATGHDWAEPVWSGTPTSSEDVETAITATIQCKNEHCDGGADKAGYNKTPLKLNVTVEQTAVGEKATCEKDGKATYTASASHSEVDHEPYTKVYNDVKLPALKHQWSEPKFVWDFTTSGKWELKSAARTCANGENCDINKGTQEGTNIETVTDAESDKPTYEEAGSIKYTGKASFKDTSTGPDVVKEEVQTEELPKLTPEVKKPEVQNKTAVETKPDLTALGTAVNDLVKDALASDSAPAGMDKTLYDLIRKAGASETPDDLTVTTKLVVEDEDTAALTGLPAGAADKVKDAFDITIQVTVSGSGVDGETVKTGYITEIDESIPFTVKLPEGGPIWYVLSDHGGAWHEIDSRVENGNIVFTTSQFSKFALISSSDLADAVVTPSAIPDQTYTGSPIQPKVELTVNGGQKLTEGKDYVVAYENNTDVTDAAKIVITPAEGSAFTGRIELTFKIVKAPAAGGSGSSTKPTEAPVPATGDETPVALYAVMLTLSAAALTFVLARRRRQK